MKLQLIILALLLSFNASSLLSQDVEKNHGFENKHSIGTQAFMILTPILDPSPEYYQLNYGYRFSSKHELAIEAITWSYTGPLGRPFGPDYESEESGFPGDVKSLGMGLAYKRFLWKGVYTQIHSTAFQQSYRDHKKNEIQKGFMLFNTLRLGYHFKFLKNRFYVAPSIGGTWWPVSTNMPESFLLEEDQWNNFFLGEFGLHIGYAF